MNDYDVYLFDWDGTLLQSNEMWVDLVREQLAPHGIRMTDAEVVSKIMGRYKTGLQELGFSSAEIDMMGIEIDEVAKQRYAQFNLYPYATEVLTVLKSQHKKLALVTSSWREVIDVALAAHDLLDLFDVIVTGDEVTAQKPDPQGILAVLDRLGIAPNHAIMAGDSPKDLMAAKNAGVDSLLFYPPAHETQHNREELEACAPAYTIRSWQELLDQLQ